MKRFLIAYTFRLDADAEVVWQRTVADFIAELDRDPVLAGRIGYRCMRAKAGGAYYHLAEPADDEAAAVLQTRDYFRRYTDETRRVAGGTVEVTPLETIAETRR